MTECAEEGCEREAMVRVHVPWERDRNVCTGHARVIVQQDGVVGTPLEGSEEGWR